MTRRRRLLFAAVVAGAALVAGAMALPLLGGVFNPPPPPDTPGLYRKSSVPALEYEHTPGWKGMVAGAEAAINSSGLRGPEVAPEPLPGVTRLAMVGDSIVFGQGVTDDRTLPAALARELERQTDRSYEVLNAGVRGYASRQYPALAARALAFKPRLLILVVTVVNDPEREPWRPDSPELQRLSKSWYARLPFLKPLLFSAYSNEINRLFRLHVSEIYNPEGKTWQPFLADLAAVQAQTQTAGVRLLALVYPSLEGEGLFEAQTRQLEQELKKMGIEAYNPEPTLRANHFKELVVSLRDFHPNARANQIVASFLAGPVLKALEEN